MKFKTLLRCMLALLPVLAPVQAKEKHLLYVASPGIRNYLEYGGMGILVFDIDDGYKFVKRIPTWDVPPPAKQAENVKGIAASGKTGQVYVSTINRMARVRRRHRQASFGTRRMKAAATAWPLRPTARPSTCLRSKGRTGTSWMRDRQRHHEDRAEVGLAQYSLFSRRHARLPGGSAFAAAFGGGHVDQQDSGDCRDRSPT